MRIALALLVLFGAAVAQAEPVDATSIPPGKRWYCPSAKVHDVMYQCARTREGCQSLMETAAQNTLDGPPPCVKKTEVYCHSFRARGGMGYGKTESYCFSSAKACEAARADAAQYGSKYRNQSECTRVGPPDATDPGPPAAPDPSTKAK